MTAAVMKFKLWYLEGEEDAHVLEFNSKDEKDVAYRNINQLCRRNKYFDVEIRNVKEMDMLILLKMNGGILDDDRHIV